MILDVVVTAILSFVSTNIDDIFILMLLFAQATRKSEKIRIAMGQYMGIIVLVILSWIGALATKAIPEQYIRFLGLVPIALGIKVWLDNQKKSDNQTSGNDREETIEVNGLTEKISGNHMLRITSVMFLTIANGADNIGIYIPVFSRYDVTAMIILVIVFTGMTVVWCLAGYQLANLPVVKRIIQRYQHILVPIVLLGLGIYILVG